MVYPACHLRGASSSPENSALFLDIAKRFVQLGALPNPFRQRRRERRRACPLIRVIAEQFCLPSISTASNFDAGPSAALAYDIRLVLRHHAPLRNRRSANPVAVTKRTASGAGRCGQGRPTKPSGRQSCSACGTINQGSITELQVGYMSRPRLRALERLLLTSFSGTKHCFRHRRAKRRARTSTVEHRIQRREQDTRAGGARIGWMSSHEPTCPVFSCGSREAFFTQLMSPLTRC